MRGGAGLVIGILACEAQPLEVTLALGGQDCEIAVLAEVRVVTVEIYGTGDDEDLCTLGRRCIFVDAPPASIDAMAAVLTDANQPLVDAELAGAEYVHVAGRTSCWDQPDPITGVPPTPATCGANDLAEIDDGTLSLTMRCDFDCPAEQVPLCN